MTNKQAAYLELAHVHDLGKFRLSICWYGVAHSLKISRGPQFAIQVKSASLHTNACMWWQRLACRVDRSEDLAKKAPRDSGGRSMHACERRSTRPTERFRCQHSFMTVLLSRLLTFRLHTHMGATPPPASGHAAVHGADSLNSRSRARCRLSQRGIGEGA